MDQNFPDKKVDRKHTSSKFSWFSAQWPLVQLRYWKFFENEDPRKSSKTIDSLHLVYSKMYGKKAPIFRASLKRPKFASPLINWYFFPTAFQKLPVCFKNKSTKTDIVTQLTYLENYLVAICLLS